MNDMSIIREALWQTSHKYGTAGTHDGDLVSNALSDLVQVIEKLIAEERRKESA